MGAFTLEDATALDVLAADPLPRVLSPADALRGMERVGVGADVATLVANGRVFDDAPFETTGQGAVRDRRRDRARLLAVYERHATGLKPSVVLPVDAPGDGGGE